MYKPRILDLFCKAGGASKGYADAGFEVIGVDIDPQPNYSYPFIQADALQVLMGGNHWRATDGNWYGLNDFDAFHASPPCQRYSMMQRIHKNPDNHPDLVDPTRQEFLKHNKPWVIENVVGAPLREDLLLCGTMFGMRIAKHRIFEISFPIINDLPTCDHTDIYDCYHGGEAAQHEREKLCAIFKIDWYMTRPEVRNCIPPAYTKFIGDQLMRIING